MTITTAGSSTSDTFWISDNVGTSHMQPGQPIITQGSIPQAPVGDVMNLVKTAAGEFVLTGANAQRLLMEYFEQSPELWLRLLALKADKEDADG